MVRARLAVRSDPNLFWMLLSKNPEVAFPSTTATTTPAAYLPTPDNATATATATRATSTTGVSVAPNVATPCQKRKAYPSATRVIEAPHTSL
jgi:hypothetical protein